MRLKKILNVTVPPDIREWVEREAGARKMTMSDYVLQLLTKGIQAETIDETVARIGAAAAAAGNREILRQTLATRYIVEAQAKGAIRVVATLGTDANAYADRELDRLFPKRSES
jgi:hypothetical protein